MPESAIATPPPTTTPPEIPTTERAPADFMADAMSDFEALDAGKPLPRDEKGKFVKPAEKPPKAPEKPAEGQIQKPAEKPATEKPAEETPTKPDEEVKPVKAAELRTAYDDLKKRVKAELEPEIQKLRAKVREYETKPPEDTAPILQKMKALEERNTVLEKHIEYVDYQKSTEFSTKYDQPYREAWDRAVSEFRELTVREPDGKDEMDEPKFKVRPADETDLLRLGNMKLADMDTAATQMFGASAPRAIRHIEDLKRLSSEKNKALTDAEKRALEWKSKQQLEFKSRNDTLAKTWAEVNKSLEEKFPKAFKPEEGDEDDKAAYVKGRALADLMFLGEQGLTPEQVEHLPAAFKDTIKANKSLTDAQRIQLHAIARLKMLNHDRKTSAVKKRDARIAELEKILAEYEQSEPKADKAGGSAPAGGTKDWLETAEDELRALDK